MSHRSVSSTAPDLLSQVRHALIQAGFHLVEAEAEGDRPGLAVTEVPAGVLVGWAASDKFASLVRNQRGALGDSVQAVVRAAVSGLLVRLRHMVTEPSDGGDLLVLADK
ncbi:hypothetical protein [Streptomyces sp. NPDC088915]|uniref:hypothetical protein n=1 Tax=Streptomyces sp. NPDC088915 TaxID=3365912 RepID=UPI0038264055